MPEVEDPVCGMRFEEETAEELGALRVVHGGRARWFCCATCRDEFVRDPGKHGG